MWFVEGSPEEAGRFVFEEFVFAAEDENDWAVVVFCLEEEVG